MWQKPSLSALLLLSVMAPMLCSSPTTHTRRDPPTWVRYALSHAQMASRKTLLQAASHLSLFPYPANCLSSRSGPAAPHRWQSSLHHGYTITSALLVRASLLASLLVKLDNAMVGDERQALSHAQTCLIHPDFAAFAVSSRQSIHCPVARHFLPV